MTSANVVDSAQFLADAKEGPLPALVMLWHNSPSDETSAGQRDDGHGVDLVQLAYGPRVPLLMFGGTVKQTIDNRWCGHASIPKTAIDLLGLPALGVPRLDQAPSLADLVDSSGPPTPAPPAFGTALTVPPAPSPPIAPKPPPPPPSATPSPVSDILLRDGSTLPAPNDAPLPRQPHAPSNGVRGDRSG